MIRVNTPEKTPILGAKRNGNLPCAFFWL